MKLSVGDKWLRRNESFIGNQRHDMGRRGSVGMSGDEEVTRAVEGRHGSSISTQGKGANFESS
jgi:hypothetical protein